MSTKKKSGLLWETADTYTQKPLKQFSKKKHKDYDPTGSTSIKELIARAEQGMLVPVYPLEYGEDEEVNPAYRQDRDLTDLEASLNQRLAEQEKIVKEEEEGETEEADTKENDDEKPKEDV